MRDPVVARRLLVDQLRDAGVRDPRVLGALERVPRHLFVPAADRPRAYEDCALPLAEGATISQPRVVAWMLAALDVLPGERALDVGSGSGYTSALLAELGAEVDGIERLPGLVAAARATLRELAHARVRIHLGDGHRGLPTRAPFDAVLVSAACDEVPPALLAQLAPGGRLVAPVGAAELQRIELWQRPGEAPPERLQRGEAVRFVPLLRERRSTPS
jgi:protein-L-isoaspartate(D-aspartate) O-methyltransferase